MLDRQGRSVKTIDPAPTAEQRKAIEVEAERQRELAKADAERARRDRALTQSFSSEAEIDVARRAGGVDDGGATDDHQRVHRRHDTPQGGSGKRKAGYGTKPGARGGGERTQLGDRVELTRQTALLAQKKEAPPPSARSTTPTSSAGRKSSCEQDQAAERQRAVDAQKASAPSPQTRGKSAAAAAPARRASVLR